MPEKTKTHCCGNCAFSRRNNELQIGQIECRFGPPHATTLVMARPGGLGGGTRQLFVSYPVVDSHDWGCHQFQESGEEEDE